MNGGFAVVAARFTLRAADIAERLEEAREFLARSSAPPPLVLDHWRLARAIELHCRFLLWARVVAELESATAAGRDIEWAADDPAVVWCQRLVLAGRFDRVECPVCHAGYGGAECAVLNWGHQPDPLMGMGGQRVRCPAGHTLYARHTWVSERRTRRCSRRRGHVGFPEFVAHSAPAGR